MFRNRSTLIYLALVLGLVCYLTFIDKKIPGTREQAEADTQLFKFDQQLVTGLEIDNVHGAFVFEKKNDHWEITSPVNTLADTATIMEILGQISYAQPQRTIPIEPSDKATETNLKEWGLSPAAERVVIHLKDKSLELMIGRKIAINESVYARTSSRKSAPVRIIPLLVKTALQKNLSDFRSRNVFDFDTASVNRISTRISNTATTPAQDCGVDLKDGKWMMQKPVVARAAGSDAMNLLNKILALRVTDFVTDDPSNLAQYGLTSPSATLSVTVGTDEEGVLQIGSPVLGKADQIYAQRVKSNSVLILSQTAVNDVFKALPNVRDRHIIPVDPGKVTDVSFEMGTKKVDLHREKGIWITTGEYAGTADVGKVTDVLSRLSQLQTTPVFKDSAPDLKPYGLDKPSGKITLTTPELKTPFNLLIGKNDNHLLYVRNSTEPFIYTVPDTTFDFLGDSLSYLDSRAINLVLTDVREMTITPQGKTPLELTRSQGGTWSVAHEKDRMVDSAKAETQASLLCQLQAHQWLGITQPAYALTKPVLTIAVQTANGNSTTLRIGAPLPDGNHAAQIEGSKTVFSLSDSDYGLLNASSLELIPEALKGTNTVPSTNTAPATNSAPLKPLAPDATKPSSPPKKKKPTP